MDILLTFFDVNTTFFTLLGYPISYLEFTGTIFNLASVWLVAKRNIWTWPVAMIGVILFGIMFYQIQLYADFFEQIYYFITGLWGWYLWQTGKEKEANGKVVITRNTRSVNVYWIAGIALTSIVATFLLTNLNTWLPDLFPEPASLPALDATTTVMSFAATILMIKRKVESWVLWVLVDIVAVGLYYYKEVPFVALLYLIFLGIATTGLVNWYRLSKKELV